ncbi:MAG: RagB/SusD family nutrient uptake outer membrane protein [Bacteroides sp.]|nr:RagB/SusD family nutrient uptake outer membrane protein [Bacteroides sp.]
MKIFKILSTAALGLTVTLGMSSCVNDWLDQSPSDSVDAESAIKNSENLGSVRTGLYAALKGNSTLTDYYSRLMFIYGDVRGEDVQYNHISGSSRASFYYYMTYSTADDFTSSSAVWQSPYIVIARANRIIDAAESGNLTDQEEAQATISQYEAEAKVLRAMAHFDLTRIYGTPYTEDNGASLGVPLVTATLESTAKPARSTVAECYAAIEADLEDAVESGALLTESTPGYINEWAAKALQVRVYLTKGEWSNVLTVADDIIENSPYTLWTTDQYASAWDEENANHENEVIAEIAISSSTDWTDREGIAYIYTDPAGTPSGYGDVIITKALSDELTSDPLDVRNNVLKVSGAGEFDGRAVYINKLPQPGGTGDVRMADVPLLRLSEVYLSAAEAAYNNGDLAAAASYLNSIISNRTTDTSKQVTSSSITLDRIYMERRKELFGEGQRYFDAMRRGETITRYTSEADQGWHDALNTEARSFSRESTKALPLIPVDEINANPNIEQNPSY